LTWIGRELRKNDMKALVPLVEAAPHPSGLFVKAALARGEGFKGWWYGAWRDGQTLEAVIAVENHQGLVYASNDEAARGLAEELYAMQKRFGPSGQPQRHQLLGEAKMMAIVWPIMRDLPRKLVFDKDCELLQAVVDETPAPSSRVLIDLAQRSDERIVHDFSAELCIEQMGVDPRKTGRDTHSQRVSDLIAYGRELVAKEKDNGRPYFVGELAPLSDRTTMLTDTYVPTHYRARGKLLAQAFWATARHPTVAGKDLVYLGSNPLLTAAAKAAGWKWLAGYRWSVTHG
jgi:hypothetical protein